MTVAYIAPYYPHVSHSFIRREIAALESLGFKVQRYSLRSSQNLVDPADIAEAAKTTVLLEAGFWRLLGSLAVTAFLHPIRFTRTMALSFQCGRRSDRGVFRHWIYLAEACLLVRMLAKQKVAHLHAHFGTNAATIAMLAHALGGPPFSFTVHGPEEFDQPLGMSLAAKIERAAFVIAISSYGRSQLFRWCGSQHWPKIYVVHCGVDASFLTAIPTPIPDAPRFVCVGRLCEQKGQLLLIEAFGELARGGTPFELVLAGDGPMRLQVEAAIQRHKLADRVRITGWIGGEQVRRELQAARALVLPSFAEGLPVVIMEALALGRPVITTYVAGIPELVRPGVEGWLVPAGSIPDLVNALRCAIQSPTDRLTEMGNAGKSRVTERHDANREASRLAACLRK